ncbi:unnamed protein product, partial [Prorocentrum cordatum]
IRRKLGLKLPREARMAFFVAEIEPSTEVTTRGCPGPRACPADVAARPPWPPRATPPELSGSLERARTSRWVRWAPVPRRSLPASSRRPWLALTGDEQRAPPPEAAVGAGRPGVLRREGRDARAAEVLEPEQGGLRPPREHGRPVRGLGWVRGLPHEGVEFGPSYPASSAASSFGRSTGAARTSRGTNNDINRPTRGPRGFFGSALGPPGGASGPPSCYVCAILRSPNNNNKFGESDWVRKKTKIKRNRPLPKDAPQYAPFYSDLVKAWRDEQERGWGKKQDVMAMEKAVKDASEPFYFMDSRNGPEMKQNPEFWLQPQRLGPWHTWTSTDIDDRHHVVGGEEVEVDAHPGKAAPTRLLRRVGVRPWRVGPHLQFHHVPW